MIPSLSFALWYQFQLPWSNIKITVASERRKKIGGGVNLCTDKSSILFKILYTRNDVLLCVSSQCSNLYTPCNKVRKEVYWNHLVFLSVTLLIIIYNFWAIEPFATELGMLVNQHKSVSCKKIGLLSSFELICPCHIKVLNPEKSMIWSLSLTCWSFCNRTGYASVSSCAGVSCKMMYCCLQGQSHIENLSPESVNECLSIFFSSEPLNSLWPNFVMVCWCIITRWSVMQKIWVAIDL